MSPNVVILWLELNWVFLYRLVQVLVMSPVRIAEFYAPWVLQDAAMDKQDSIGQVRAHAEE